MLQEQIQDVFRAVQYPAGPYKNIQNPTTNFVVTLRINLAVTIRPMAVTTKLIVTVVTMKLFVSTYFL